VGSISGTTLTLASVAAGAPPAVGAPLTGAGVAPGTVVTADLGGGKYTVSVPQTVAPGTVIAAGATPCAGAAAGGGGAGLAAGAAAEVKAVDSLWAGIGWGVSAALLGALVALARRTAAMGRAFAKQKAALERAKAAGGKRWVDNPLKSGGAPARPPGKAPKEAKNPFAAVRQKTNY
jgi:hypothetical protein